MRMISVLLLGSILFSVLAPATAVPPDSGSPFAVLTTLDICHDRIHGITPDLPSLAQSITAFVPCFSVEDVLPGQCRTKPYLLAFPDIQPPRPSVSHLV